MTIRRFLAPARIVEAGVIGLALLWCMVSLAWPVGESQGIFAWVGDVILRGGMPYADAWETRGPFPLYAFAVAMGVLGRHQWAIRVLDLVFVGAAVWAIARLVRHLASPTASRWAAAAFVLWYGSMTFAETAQPDAWVGMMLMAAMAPLLIAGNAYRTRHLVVAGVLIGFCALNKPFYLGFLALPVVFVFAHRGLAFREIVRAGLLSLAGLLIPVAAVVTWFALRGSLDDFVAVHLLYTSSVYKVATLALGRRTLGVVEYVWRGKVSVVALLPAAYGAVVLWRTHRPAALVLGTWVALGAAFVALQNNFFAYHWLVITPAIVALGACGIHDLLALADDAGAWRRRVMGTLLLGVILLHVAIRPAFYAVEWAKYVTGRTTQEAYLDQLNSTYGGVVEPTEVALGVEFLRTRTSERDRIVVFGNEALLPVLSGRATVSRLGGWSGPLNFGRGTPEWTAYRTEYMAALRASPPEWIVLNRDLSRYEAEDQVEAFPELQEFLQANYQMEQRVRDLEMYRRTTSGSRP